MYPTRFSAIISFALLSLPCLILCGKTSLLFGKLEFAAKDPGQHRLLNPTSRISPIWKHGALGDLVWYLFNPVEAAGTGER